MSSFSILPILHCYVTQLRYCTCVPALKVCCNHSSIEVCSLSSIRYENVISGEDGDNVTVDLVTLLLDILFGTEVVAMETTTMALVGGNESIQYVIPDRMVVTMEPREEVHHNNSAVCPISLSGCPFTRRDTWFM